ncbi:MAG: sugar phosphate isomerase/epimerase [Methanophagales archaeon]|nr:sugar phosphate isomerase/epimerase [Methanophagales archaeon]
MKIGISTSVIYKDWGFDIMPIFPLANKLKIDTIEIVIDEETLKWIEKYKTDLKEQSKGLKLFFHPYDIELNKLTLQSKKLNEIFDLCVEFEVDRLVIHPGFGKINQDLANIKEIITIAGDAGIIILVENGYKRGELFRSIDEQLGYVKRIRERGIENIYVVFDVWRAFKVYKDTIVIAKYLKILLKSGLLKHIHFSDGKRLLDTSVALGDGEINVDLLLDTLKDFKDSVILEVDTPEDAIKSVRYLMDRNLRQCPNRR